jgi:hypothetical protein
MSQKLTRYKPALPTDKTRALSHVLPSSALSLVGAKTISPILGLEKKKKKSISTPFKHCDRQLLILFYKYRKTGISSIN